MSISENEPRQRPRRDVALRASIESRFESWGSISGRNPWLIIAAMVTLALALGNQMQFLTIDTSSEAFLREDDPTRVVYSEFRERYGNDQLAIVALRPKHVFDPEFLEKLLELHDAIETKVPFVEEVTSLINVRETRGDGDELIVRDLLEGWPLEPAELREIEARALSNPLYQNYLISGDQRATTLVIKLVSHVEGPGADDALAGFDEEVLDEESGPAEIKTLTGEQEVRFEAALSALLERYRSDDLEIYVCGGPISSARISTEMMHNISVFMTLSLLGVAVFLFALFRRLSAVVLPLVVVLLSIVSTFGAMGLIGMPMGVPTQILPSFLLAVGVGGSVHLLVLFFRDYDAGQSREAALSHALSHSGLAIVMTALTTAGGLISFVSADVQPVSDLGVFAPLGIGLGLLYCMVLLPACLHVIPLRRRPPPAENEESWIVRTMMWVGDRCVHHPNVVLGCMSAILIFAFAGITQLGFSYDPISWFPVDDPLRVGTEFVNDELGGSVSLEILVDTGRENGLHDPEILARIDELSVRSQEIERIGLVEVGKVTSIVDVTKEIHQALNENRTDFYAIPASRELIAQELLLFENSGADDLEELVDTTFQRARITMILPIASPTDYQPFMTRVERLAHEILGDDVEIMVTGFASLMTRSLDVMATSLRRSYLVALAIITPLMFLVLGTVRTGLAAMVPNLAPIILTLGLMGWLGIPLDTFTLLIGSIAIGLAVDDTIHFMHVFRKYYEELGDTPEAVRETLRTTGHALLVTSIVLSLSFFIYSFASLTNLVKFGALTGLTVIFAFVADICLSPALMALSTRGDRKAARRRMGLKEEPTGRTGHDIPVDSDLSVSDA